MGRHNLVKDDFLLLHRRRLQFLLDEAGPVLVSAELGDVSEDILQSGAVNSRSQERKGTYP